MKSVKKSWKKPLSHTIKKENINKTIIASACSKYMGGACSPGFNYIDSIPGGGKPEFE